MGKEYNRKGVKIGVKFRVFKINKFPLIVVYRINKKTLEVSRIFHTSRNIANESI
jgi:plasmid stabilization system protein ParE